MCRSARSMGLVVLAGTLVSAMAAQPPLRNDERAGLRAIHREVPNDPYLSTPPQPPRSQRGKTRWTRGPHVSVQVNTDALGGNIVGDAGNEPSIAMDPTNPNRMAIGWRQFDNIASDFRQAGWAYTADGGQTWTSPGVIEPGIFRSDPVLDADSQGNFYYNSLTTDWIDFWCHVFKSSDGGQTWDAGTYAQGGDKQWMAIDRTSGIGQGNIYAFWNSSFTVCPPGHFTRSYNGGQSYTACTSVPGDPYWGTLAVGPDGELYASGNGFVVAKSTTLQDAFLPPAWDFSTSVSLGGNIVYSAGPNPGGLLGQAWIAVDHSDGPTRGHVYLFCSVDPSGSDPLDVMFARSTDGGQNWSAPVRVNDDSTTNGAWQWFGTMSVAPNGRIDAIWNDTRNASGGYDSELYYAYSDDAGQTWSTNEALSQPFDPHLGWPQQNKIGDYYDMVSDDSGANLAYAATFNGEQDVYFLRITRGMRIAFPKGLPDLLTPGEPTDITVQIIEGSDTYIESTGTLHHRYDGGVFISSVLVPLGGELYRATLPAAGCSDTPEFYFSAEGTDSGIIYEPPTAPASSFAADVGEVTVIMSNDMESDQGWTVGSPGDDATTGVWVRVDPNGTAAQPEDDHTSAPGTMCFVTGQGSPGGGVGDNDVDGGQTTLSSPTIDLLAASDAGIGYWRWYSNSEGGSPQSDIFEVEISNNDGATWINVETVGPTGGEAMGGWYYHEVPVSDFVTPTAQVKVRFIASDLGSGSIVEAAVDDFSVRRLGCESGEATCVDGIHNQGEDRIDCGGPCPACECTADGACEDGQYCTGDETCDAYGTCQSSGDPCIDPNFSHCNEGGQSCDECLTAIHCDDEVACTVDDCQAGACANTADDGLCDDGDLCTTDTCEAVTGCVYEYQSRPFGDLAPWFAWEPGAPRQPDLDDFFCLLDDYANGEAPDLCPGSDLAPCGGDDVIGVDDIAYFLDAFGGNPPCPAPCPP